MARIRTLKPEWLEDEMLLAAGSDARVLSVALILLADDYGNGRGNERWLASQVFPLDEDGPERLREGLAKLRGWFATVYEVRGQRYFHLEGWKNHQRVDKPGKPRVPGPDDPEAVMVSGISGVARDIRDGPANLPESLAPDRDHDHDLEEDRDAREDARRDVVDDPLSANESTGWVTADDQGPSASRVAEVWNGLAQQAGSSGHPVRYHREDFGILAGLCQRLEAWERFLGWYWGPDGWGGQHPNDARPASLAKAWDLSVEQWRDPAAFARRRERGKRETAQTPLKTDSRRLAEEEPIRDR